MNYKYLLVKTVEGQIVEKEYKTLKEIANDLNVELHIIRKINNLSENAITNERPHRCHKELYEKIKIYNIKKEYNI